MSLASPGNWRMLPNQILKTHAYDLEIDNQYVRDYEESHTKQAKAEVKVD
jgi:hypothetical protein